MRDGLISVSWCPEVAGVWELMRAVDEGGKGQRAITRTGRGVFPYSYSVDVCICVSNRVGRK